MSWQNYAAIFENDDLRKNNTSLFLHDYVLPKVDAFLTIAACSPDGLARPLNKKAPIYDLTRDRTRTSVDSFEKNVISPLSQSKNLMAISATDCLGYELVDKMNKKGFLATNTYEVYTDFMKALEPVLLFKLVYLGTSRYIIKVTQKYLTVGYHSSPDSVFHFQSDRTVKAFIREAPYIFDWPLDVYHLYINGEKHSINSRSKENRIFTVDTNKISIDASHSKACFVIIQEI